MVRACAAQIGADCDRRSHPEAAGRSNGESSDSAGAVNGRGVASGLATWLAQQPLAASRLSRCDGLLRNKPATLAAHVGGAFAPTATVESA